MQEDKEAVFDAIDTVKMCLNVYTGMVSTMKVLPENMREAAGRGFINATDLADYLVRKKMPFRDAYKISGRIVSECIRTGTVLEKLPLEEYRKFSELFDEDVYKAIDLNECVQKRTSAGGPSNASVLEQLQYARSIFSRKVTACPDQK